MATEIPTGEICLNLIMEIPSPMMLLEIRLMMEPGPIHGRKAVNLQRCLMEVLHGHIPTTEMV